MQQLKGNGTGVEMCCRGFAESQITDYKKNRPNAFAVPENKVLNVAEQYRESLQSKNCRSIVVIN